MTKRDKAKRRLMMDTRKKLNRMIEDAMSRRGIAYPELMALTGIPNEQPTLDATVKKLSCAGLVRIMFELGYELHITPIPLNKGRLNALSGTD